MIFLDNFWIGGRPRVTTMQNAAAVEALYSATYAENFLECMENLPNELQKNISRLREYDFLLHRVSWSFLSIQCFFSKYFPSVPHRSFSEIWTR